MTLIDDVSILRVTVLPHGGEEDAEGSGYADGYEDDYDWHGEYYDRGSVTRDDYRYHLDVHSEYIYIYLLLALRDSKRWREKARGREMHLI